MYPTEKQQSENMKSGFEKTGICPLNENIVLKRLPDGNNDSTNDDTGSSKHQVSAALIDMLAEMRGVNKDVEIRRRRKKINVAPGKSIGVEDIMEPSASAGTSTGTATAPDNVDDDVEPDSDVTVNESVVLAVMMAPLEMRKWIPAILLTGVLVTFCYRCQVAMVEVKSCPKLGNFTSKSLKVAKKLIDTSTMLGRYCILLGENVNMR